MIPPDWFKRLDCGPSGSSIGCYAWLAEIAREAGARRILEIGTHWGAGTAALVVGRPRAAVETVDCLPDPGNLGDAVLHERRARNWERADAVGRIVCHLGRSQEVVPHLAGPFDLVLIDGNHDWDLKRADWEAVKDRAAVVVFDDLVPWWPFWTEAIAAGWTRAQPSAALLAECFPGGHSEAWSEGQKINDGIAPKFGILRAPRR